jgi:hypothetical protein
LFIRFIKLANGRKTFYQSVFSERRIFRGWKNSPSERPFAILFEVYFSFSGGFNIGKIDVFRLNNQPVKIFRHRTFVPDIWNICPAQMKTVKFNDCVPVFLRFRFDKRG